MKLNATVKLKVAKGILYWRECLKNAEWGDTSGYQSESQKNKLRRSRCFRRCFSSNKN